jgi:hypothetical protein
MDPEYPYYGGFQTYTHPTTTTTNVYSLTLRAHDGDSYEAVNEQPRVFCSSGPSPVDALKAMSDILSKHGIKTWTASSVHFDDDGVHYLTIYV